MRSLRPPTFSQHHLHLWRGLCARVRVCVCSVCAEQVYEPQQLPCHENCCAFDALYLRLLRLTICTAHAFYTWDNMEIECNK